MAQIEQVLAVRKGISERVARLRQQGSALPDAAAHLVAITALPSEQAAIDGELATVTREQEAGGGGKRFLVWGRSRWRWCLCA